MKWASLPPDGAVNAETCLRKFKRFNLDENERILNKRLRKRNHFTAAYKLSIIKLPK